MMEHPFSSNAIEILNKRYLRKNNSGELIETPREMFMRVASAVAEAEDTPEDWTDTFFDMMWSLRFLPNSPTLVNAGTAKGSLSACFVISPEDTMESIMKTAYDAALVEKWGGGIGFGLSDIRPKNDKISTTHGKALGPLGVMRIYSKIGNEITQGSFRLGAHMAMLSADHPDIFDFISCKDSLGNSEELTNFNISVQVTDAFMHAVVDDLDWDLVNPHNQEVVKTIKARKLWDSLVASAWKTGDPGIAYMSMVWATQPNPQLGNIKSSNPCGEEMLENYGSCNLGSINLAKHLNADGTDIDYKQLRHTINVAVRFLDDVVDINIFPIEELKDINLRTRRIGLGVMGWADVLMLLGIPYDSIQSIALATRLGTFIKDTALAYSQHLAKEKGTFPEYENSALKKIGILPIRNSSVTTTAPTGTISRIAGCSSGIEPYFALAWKSNVLWDSQNEASVSLLDVPEPVRRYLEAYMPDEDVQDFLNSVVLTGDVPHDLILKAGLNKKLLLSTALNISAEAHVRMQAIWQRACNTNATSKTINLPQTATKEDISNAYMLAWKLGCKGITVYRQGSRDVEVLSNGANVTNTPNKTTRWERPVSLNSITDRTKTGHGTLFITRGYDDKTLREVFLSLGKAGGCESANMEAIARLVSIALQYDVPTEAIIKQLSGVTCCPAWDNGVYIKSPADALANVLLGKQENKPNMSGVTNISCPECNSSMISEAGCWTCSRCSYSKCG